MSNENSAKSATQSHTYDEKTFEAAYFLGTKHALEAIGVITDGKESRIVGQVFVPALEAISREVREKVVSSYPGPLADMRANQLKGN